jgi:hypothetical protein
MLNWYVRRLSRMTVGEAIRRARDLGAQMMWRPRKGAVTLPRAARCSQNTVRLSLPAAAAESVPAAARNQILEAADCLLQGEWTVFGSPIKGFGRDIDWFQDPHTRRGGASDIYCFDVPHGDVSRVGISRQLWEISRHQHLTVLAAAYHLSKERRYAIRIAEHLGSWWQANPVLTGIHWSSALEIGLRLISWTWVRRLLAEWPGVTGLFEENPVFLVQLYYHQVALAKFHSHGSSANNHLIGEAAGLFIASVAFPLFRSSRRWCKFAARLLEREILRQTDEQGMHRELATEYHAFVLELLLAAAVEGDAAGAPFSEVFWCRLKMMVDATASIMDCTGRPPRQGDADGGIGLLLDAPGFDRWKSLLATGARLFGAAPWWKNYDLEDVRTVFVTALASSRNNIGERPVRRIAHFKDAGTVILRDETLGQYELWCRCDHGPLGFLAIAAHAHADALSVEVRHGGVDILADPGTYCYGRDSHWRQYYRSTLAHNTLELGGLNQAISGGAFLWLTRPNARLHMLEGLDNGPIAILTASHDGYRRRLGALHYRSVTLERGAGRLMIEDWIDAAEHQNCRLAFHLGPAVTAELLQHRARLEWQNNAAGFAAILALPAELVWSVHRADGVAGWYSEGYARISPATTLVGTGQLAPSIRLVTELVICDSSSPSFGGLPAVADLDVLPGRVGRSTSPTSGIAPCR